MILITPGGPANEPEAKKCQKLATNAPPRFYPRPVFGQILRFAEAKRKKDPRHHKSTLFLALIILITL